MNYSDALQVCLQEKFRDFSGRGSLGEFWWFMLACFMTNTIAVLVGGLFGLVVVLALMLPGLAAASRRLHDVGHHGAWLWLMLLPPLSLILLWWLTRPSMPHENQYGPVPVIRSGFDD